jgi:hypothetical protein
MRAAEQVMDALGDADRERTEYIAAIIDAEYQASHAPTPEDILAEMERFRNGNNWESYMYPEVGEGVDLGQEELIKHTREWIRERVEGKPRGDT